MSKIYAAAALMLGLALGSGHARADINVGPGFGTPCAEGGCPLVGGSVNAIGTSSLDFFQTSTGPVDTSALLLIFAVPNNPTNALAANPVLDAQLHVHGTNPASTPVTVGSLSPETLFTHGTVYPMGDVVSFGDLQSADYSLFPAIYNPTTNPIANFSLYQIPLTTAVPFAGNDLINIDFTSLPTGTFALGYATPSLTVTDTPFAEAGVAGAAVSAVPEPSTLTLLLGFLFLGLQLSRRRN
jgi:hypothetical protein